MSQDQPPPQRVGYEERDAAVEALQEHHSLGRLDAGEFEERMTKALQAKVSSELAVLFRDLPEPRPAFLAGPVGPPASAASAPQPYHVQPAPQWHGPPPTPWFAQWWMILLAVGITVASRGSVGFIIPMMAVWLFVIYPSIAGNKSRQARGVAPPQHVAAADALQDWQRNRILTEIQQGRKIQAIKVYREYTGAGLYDAKQVIDHMSRQIEG